MNKLTFVFALVVSATWASAAEAVHFGRDIYPILEANCFKCHGPEKQKGKLRLDTKEGIFKDDEVIVAGNPDESELFYRITLPADDEDIMPPEGKGDPLSAEQQALFKRWIEEGAEWSEPVAVAAAENADGGGEDVDFERDILPIFRSLSGKDRSLLARWLEQGADMPGASAEAAAAEPKLVEAEETEASKKAAEELRAAGVNVMKVAQNVNWLYANFRLSGGDVTDAGLAPLEALPNLTDLDLSQTGITDAGLDHIKDLANLTRLNLNNTAITDEGVARLEGLTNLQYLNLYGTKVGNAGLQHLTGLKCLQKVFLWQTQVTPDGAKELQASLPAAEINLGIETPESVAKSEKEEAEVETVKAPKAAKVEKTGAKDGEHGLSIATVLLQLTSAEPPAAEPSDAEQPEPDLSGDAPEVAVAEVPSSTEADGPEDSIVADVEEGSAAVGVEVAVVDEIGGAIQPEVVAATVVEGPVASEPEPVAEPGTEEKIGIAEAVLLIQ